MTERVLRSETELKASVWVGEGLFDRKTKLHKSGYVGHTKKTPIICFTGLLQNTSFFGFTKVKRVFDLRLELEGKKW